MASSPDSRPVFDVDALRRASRDLPAQFSLQLGVQLGSQLLDVEAVLRWLPARRAVLRVRAVDGTARVAKLFLRRAVVEMQRERAGLQALATAGFVVPRLLEEQRRGVDEGVLQFEYIADATTLAERWLTMTDETRVRCLRALVAGLARLHALGVRARDPHLGNFLLRDDAARELALVAVDGGAIESGVVPVSDIACIEDLALLHAQLPIDDDAWAQASLVAYAAATHPVRASLPLATLQTEIARARQRRVRTILRKSMRDCSEFCVQRTAACTVVYRRALGAVARVLVESREQVFATAEILKAGNTATVARVRAADGTRWICKRYNIKGPLHFVSRAFRATRAERSWLAAQRMTALGVATAQPIALCVERIGPLRARAFLWLRDLGDDRLDRHENPDTALRANVARLIVRSHAAGLVHGDLKASNLMLIDGQPILVDLDAVRWMLPGSSRDRAQARERQRFLANWPAPESRSAWTEALAAAEHWWQARGQA